MSHPTEKRNAACSQRLGDDGVPRSPAAQDVPRSPSDLRAADKVSQVFHRLGGPDELTIGWTARFAGRPPTVEALRSYVQSRLSSLPGLTHRLTPNSKAPCWEPLSHVDMRRHVRVLDVVGEADWESAFRRVQLIPLPSECHPRWDLWLIHDAATTGQFVLLFRIHHAVSDGVGLSYVAKILCSLPQPPYPEKQATVGAGDDRMSAKAVFGIVREVTAGMWPCRVPPMFRNATTRKRSYAVGAVPTERLREIGRRLDAGIDEVFLAAVAGAMRAVALAEGRRPRPVRILWPLSTRRISEQGLPGNFVTMARILLPCDDPDPLRRHQLIGRQLTAQSSERRIQSSRWLLRLTPAPLTRLVLRRLFEGRRFPLAVTYFPLALRRPAIDGAVMTGVVGWGAPAPGQLCHLTLLRYQATCELSVVYDDAMPCGAGIPRMWKDALDELHALACAP
ncbi:wax ester/triacylglycerol synthase domain-containing protein [Streptomyces sp. NPDC002779]|uniref:wax ester/triacylglycerol synthase domain-containing protein n=1 Tax=Streptomyces sp. NPDC002779 TaxID=3364664 RepID=UPI0036944D64